MSAGIPYQAYKSKRQSHSRTSSSASALNVSPGRQQPSSLPGSTPASPSFISEKGYRPGVDYGFPVSPPQFKQQLPPQTPPKREMSVHSASPQTPPKPPPQTPPRVAQPTPRSPVPDTVSIALLGGITTPPPPQPTPSSEMPTDEQPIASSSSFSSPAPSPPPPKKTSKRTSTFRHIPLRPPTANGSSTNGITFPGPGSPLRPAPSILPGGSHSRTSSTSSVPHTGALPVPHRPTETHHRVTSFSSVLSTDSIASNPNKYNLMPSLAIGTSSSPTPSDRMVLSKGSPHRPHPISQTPSTASTTSLAPSHAQQGSASSTHTIKPAIPDRPSRQVTVAPYRPGFQPKGLYRPRTDEFIVLRGMARDGLPLPSTAAGGEIEKGIESKEGGESVKTLTKVERTKLERRFEKLVELHFPLYPPHQQANGTARPAVTNRRASSFFDLSSINLSDPGGLLRGMVGGTTAQKEAETRAAEQRITPWEEDAKVTKCPLCSASFHPLSNRKHHCRLCGQIICSLPAKRPHRPQTCSVLFIVVEDTENRESGDPDGRCQVRKIEEVGEGVDYGVRRKGSQMGKDIKAKDGKVVDDDAYLKGIRICKECRPIMLRKQYQAEMQTVPTFARLYDSFVTLEEQIEDSLPQFQELVLSLSDPVAPSTEPLSATAQAQRRKLLESFTHYDALSKKIKYLPQPDGSAWPAGSSHERVQSAIGLRAGLFLQKNMFPLQSLPRPSASTAPSVTTLSELTKKSSQSNTVDPDSELAKQLQPLLEQEALLEGFVEEARARRKFEDAKTLKVNLGEIRAEIERLLDAAEAGSGTQGKKGGKRRHR